MGVVYRGEDTRLERQVALKFLPEDVAGDRKAMDRFQREARAASALTHPNVCTIYDIGEHEGHPFIVMELLEGHTLKQRLAEGPLGVPEFLEISLQVTDALDAAHSKRIMHRDIKPANIFLTRQGQVKVVDFGLAKLLPTRRVVAAGRSRSDSTESDTSLTSSGAAVGTLFYMSPEQALGLELDPRTDLFSFGVVMYEMATGNMPFQGQTTASVVDAILHRSPASPLRLNPQLPPQLDTFILKAIEKDRSLRYQRAPDLRSDLRRLKRDLEQTSAAARPRTAARRERKDGRIRALAVLPFENLSGEPTEEFLSVGMTDALIASLAKIESVRVTSRTSVMKYKGTHRSLPEIAEELDVDAVIEGSVLRAGDRVRITAELVHAFLDRPIWAQSYDRVMDNILTVQSDLAQTIFTEVRARLVPEAHVRSTPKPAKEVAPEVQEAYLKGRYLCEKGTEEGLHRGMGYLEKAIEKDSGYALAHLGVAHAYNRMGLLGVLPAHAAYPRAKVAAIKALQLDESLAEAHVALAFTRMHYVWRWPVAETELQQALQKDPNCAAAHQAWACYHAALGRLPEAHKSILRARQLNPLSFSISIDVGLLLYLSQDYSAALCQLNDAIELFPDAELAYVCRGWVLLQQQSHDRALKDIETAMAHSKSRKKFLPELGYAYAAMGNRAEAQKTLEEVITESRRTFIPAYPIATLCAALGDNEKALGWLEDALEERYGWLIFLRSDPRLASLRSASRFQNLLNRMNFPE
jgi:serine/threonine protein kinase/Tfp pilus assembly protein PilF